MLSMASSGGRTTTLANDQMPTRSTWTVTFRLRRRSSCRRDSCRCTVAQATTVRKRSQSVPAGGGAVTVMSTMQVIAAKSQVSTYAVTRGRWRQRAH